MLYEFLKLIRDENVQSLLEISRVMRISQAMTVQMADELARKGYLQELGAGCDSPQSGCSSCPAGSSCQVPARHWFLTKKGNAVVSGQLVDQDAS
jgi:hypothetical protein